MGRAFSRLLVLCLGAGLVPACGGGGGGVVVVPAGTLSSLVISSGTLNPTFGPQTWTYTVGPALIDSSISVTATGVDLGSTITVNGVAVTSGVPSAPIPISPGTNVITIEVIPPGGSSQTYIVVIDRGGPQGMEAYVKASNTDLDDRFGYSIAISGETLVVGTRDEDSSATGVNGDETDNSASGAGAAYVFVRAGGVWTQQAYLKASNAESIDAFGISVAISGDSIVVGAALEDSIATGVNGNEADESAFNAGAAYVFTRAGGVWTQQAYLKASNTEARDTFAFTVSCFEDIIAIGAPAEKSSVTGLNGDETDNNATSAGAAYLFIRTAGVWSQQSYMKASNTDAFDFFGHSLACSADTAVVAAHFEGSSATGINGNQADNSAGDAGAVYVFE